MKGEKEDGMGKRILLAVLCVFLLWSVLDFVIHGIILRPAYEATPSLWRPMAQMKMGLMYVVVLIAASMFVLIYARLITRKSLGTGFLYGLLYGIGVGVGMGYGTYSVMPIPYSMALAWFLGAVAEAALGGLILGMILRK
jgi:hypothetical protein